MSWQTFNWLDWIVLAILLLSAIVSLMRGFVCEILSVTVWIIATIIAYLLGDELGVLLAGWIKDPSLRSSVGMFILFTMTLGIGALFNHLLTEAVRKSDLDVMDRLFGVFFGLLRGIVIVMMLILFAPVGLQQSKGWQESELIPRFAMMESGWRQAVQGLGAFTHRLVTR